MYISTNSIQNLPSLFSLHYTLYIIYFGCWFFFWLIYFLGTDSPLCEHGLHYFHPQDDTTLTALPCQIACDSLKCMEMYSSQHKVDEEKRLHLFNQQKKQALTLKQKSIRPSSSSSQHNLFARYGTGLRDPLQVTTTTLFHHFSFDQLSPIVHQLPLYSKICKLSTKNPR